jgi:diadenosine tetraphosphatase ApaH/serine/threonine PP2A family protein phosphatase
LDLLSRTFVKIDATGTSPTPRAAHAASAVDALQLVIYGGATGGGSLASDDLFLLDLRNGERAATWMIVPVVGVTPGRRYGHTLVYSKPNLIVFAGNTGSETINDVWSLNVERSPFAWSKLEVSSPPPARVYHASSLCSTGSAAGMMVTFGGRGLDQSALNDSWGLRKHRDGRWDWVKAPYKASLSPTHRYQHTTLFIDNFMLVVGGRTNTVGESVPLEVYDTENSEWVRFNSVLRFRHTCVALDSSLYVHGGFEHETPNIPTGKMLRIDTTRMLRDSSPTRKVSPKGETRPLPAAPDEKKQIQVISNSSDRGNPLQNIFINHLLRPSEWNAQANTRFGFRREHIIALTEECENIVKNQPIVLRLRAPIKIFGDIHGQYADLMRFFDLYGSPNENKKEGGDLEGFDYLFLGDFVDRGSHSLETICLLMALKCKYPEHIHLIRGNHEDKWINNAFGLSDECQVRLGEDPNDPKSVFARINRMFEFLPLAAVIEDKVICLHGGIGSSLETVDQIESLNRPLEVIHEVSNDVQQLVVDILWSDPTDHDSELGIQANVIRDPNGTGNIVKFGPDRVKDFLTRNGLSLIIRAHECVMDGFERFAGGDLITIFSATDYCGRHKNAGAVLFFKKNLEIKPKLIYPVDNPYGSNWIETEESLKKRPPTPPRWRTTDNRKKSYE